MKIRSKLLLIIMIVAACKTVHNSGTGEAEKSMTPGDDKGSSENVITEKYWKLVELHGNKVVKTESETREPHFILKQDDHAVIGNDGCNSFR
ncbi:MAG TPA: hypothetical protein VFW11_01520 [Cyclobacteriaceae bacterium]|nr:hypothetical protein [Cyclobacteriaceae bacterium]